MTEPSFQAARIRKLPKWAQDLIQKLKNDAELRRLVSQGEETESYEEIWTGSRFVRRYRDPRQEVSFLVDHCIIDVSLSLRAGLRCSSRHGRICVTPDAENVVYLRGVE